MTAKPFLDTNVLVYAFSDDDSRKNDAASLIASGGVVSVQILNEFVDVARRKLRKDWAAILQALEDLTLLLDPPLPITIDMHRDAIGMAQRYGFRIYDSLVLAAAKRAGCRLLSLHRGFARRTDDRRHPRAQSVRAGLNADAPDLASPRGRGEAETAYWVRP